MTIHRAAASSNCPACGGPLTPTSALGPAYGGFVCSACAACTPPGSAGVDTLVSQTVRSSAAPSLVAEDLVSDMQVAMFAGIRNAQVGPEEVDGLRAAAAAAFGAALHQGTWEPASLAACIAEQAEVDGLRSAAAAAFGAALQQATVAPESFAASFGKPADTPLERTRVAELEERHLLDLKAIEDLTAKNEIARISATELTAAARRRENELTKAAAADKSELEALRSRVGSLEAELADARRELADKTAAEVVVASPSRASVEGPAAARPQQAANMASQEESSLLTAAYQQISTLNTQLAHMYTELTMARTESVHAAQESDNGDGGGSAGASAITDVQKQNQQIADLVSDIRHLQLDLEYHQQKLDQLLEEKQQMMRDLKRAQQELVENRKQLEETTQMLQHKNVDLDRLKGQLQSPRVRGRAGVSADDADGAADRTAAEALRAEAAAKDSALVVSHYELHKERLLRDRLEQKNTKLMERMQKLMMVVETMRKDNVSLERALAGQERAREEGELHLRQVKQKARQLQKQAKSSKAPKARSGSSSSRSLSRGGSHKTLGQKNLELEDVPSRLQAQYPLEMGLPPLQRSIDSQSGVSTPRRVPQSARGPYGTR